MRLEQLRRPLRPLAAALALIAATAAAATAAPAPPDEPSRDVVLALDLPTGSGQPTSATVGSVLDDVDRLGLQVVDRSASLVRVRGPRTTVDALFPDAPAAPASQAAQAGPPEQGLLVPSPLSSSVTVAVNPDPTRPLWRRHDTGVHPVSARDLTAAYGVTPLPPLGPPVLTPRTPIIASLQLSSWNPADLTTYARRVLGRADDPVATGQYSPVVVADPGTFADSPEVALDQEAILGAAPQLRQRPYFTTNSAAGVLAALDRAVADARAGVPIISLSTSYGLCELAQDPAIINALEARIDALVTAGVTVTAASGDAGRYDCGDINGDGVLTPGPPLVSGGRLVGGGDDGVDFPASSPSVLSMGGTRHENGAGSALPDTAWDDGVVGTDAQGSGGGSSQGFPRPAYQTGLSPAGTTARTGRLVPDLALTADKATGSVSIVDGGPAVIGGTSLAAPLAAAHVGDLVAARTGECQAPVGLGDLHAAVYAAGSATDVVARKTRTRGGADATHAPGRGFDLATGVGTPVWSAVDAAAPRRTLVGVCDAATTEGAGPLRFRVTLDRPAASPVTVRYRVSGGTATVGSDVSPGSGSLTVHAGAAGAELALDVVADLVREPAETVQLTLTAVSGGESARIAGGTATGIIADSGAPSAGPPVSVTMKASATFVPIGRTVTLTGRLLRGGLPMPAERVLVTERYVDAPGKVLPLGVATTGPDGGWSLTFRPLYLGTVRASALGASAEVPSRVTVTYRTAAASVSGRTVTVRAETRPGFRTTPSRQERVQLLSVDARGRQLAVLGVTGALQRTFPRNEAQGTNAIRFSVTLPPGSFRLVVKVIGTPVNTGASSAVLPVTVR